MPTTTEVLWETEEGFPPPLGATWIDLEKAYNFEIYSKYADEVTVLLYAADDFSATGLAYPFDPLRNKTGRIWQASRKPEGSRQDHTQLGTVACGFAEARSQPERLDPDEARYVERATTKQAIPIEMAVLPRRETDSGYPGDDLQGEDLGLRKDQGKSHVGPDCGAIGPGTCGMAGGTQKTR